jgi:hypothetical protein
LNGSKHEIFIKNITRLYDDLNTNQGKLNFHIIQTLVEREKNNFQFFTMCKNWLYNSSDKTSGIFLFQCIIWLFSNNINGKSLYQKIKYHPVIYNDTCKELFLYNLLLIIPISIIILFILNFS